MIHIGAIRKIFRGWRILICAWVDDNSPLKSQFSCSFAATTGKSISRSERGTTPRQTPTRAWSLRAGRLPNMSGNAIGKNPLCGSASVNSWTERICSNQ